MLSVVSFFASLVVFFSSEPYNCLFSFYLFSSLRSFLWWCLLSLSWLLGVLANLDKVVKSGLHDYLMFLIVHGRNFG